MAFGPRIGCVKPFINVVDREDGRYVGLQAGVVTFHGDEKDETYKVAMVETGGRIDHLNAVDVVGHPNYHDQRVSAPCGDDANYLDDGISYESKMSRIISEGKEIVTTATELNENSIRELERFHAEQAPTDYEGDLVTFDTAS